MVKTNLMWAELRIRSYSERTTKAYLYNVKKFFEFIQKKPQEVTQQDIKLYIAYLVDKGCKERTINLNISSLKFYFEEIMKRKLFTNIKRLKIPKNIPTILSKEEIKSMILNTRNSKHKLLIELLYSSGLRVSEAVKIKTIDMDLNENFAIINGKGKKQRYVILSEKFIIDMNNYLKARNNDSVYLFDTRKGHYCIGTAQKIIKQAAKRAGLKKNVFCHALRSSFATHLIDEKTDEGIVQKLLGHARRETTRCYIKSSNNFIKDVTSPLDLV
jgi:integrase/recombinase XerD